MRPEAINAAEIITRLMKNGISQVSLSQKIGVSQPTIHRWLVGKTKPNRAECLLLSTMDEATGLSAAKNPAVLPSRTSDPDVVPDVGRIELSIPPRMAAVAADVGADLTALFATIGMDAVRSELKRRLADHDREAIQAQNAYFAEHGLPLAKYRTW